MRIKRLVGGWLALSIVMSALPARAESASGLEPTASTAAPGTFRASVDRAAASVALAPEGSKGLASGRPLRALGRSSESAAEAAGGQAVQGAGGGGRHVAALIMTLVGTAAGIGTTVYMMKQLKKVEGAPQ
jgi:hypothetical protein